MNGPRDATPSLATVLSLKPRIVTFLQWSAVPLGQKQIISVQMHLIMKRGSRLRWHTIIARPHNSDRSGKNQAAVPLHGGMAYLRPRSDTESTGGDQ